MLLLSFFTADFWFPRHMLMLDAKQLKASAQQLWNKGVLALFHKRELLLTSKSNSFFVSFCRCRACGFPLRGECINHHGLSWHVIHHTDEEEVKLETPKPGTLRSWVLDVELCYRVRHFLNLFWFCGVSELRWTGDRLQWRLAQWTMWERSKASIWILIADNQVMRWDNR
jgi:hypothetical protein